MQQFQHQHCPQCKYLTSSNHLPYHQLYKHHQQQCVCGEEVTPSLQHEHYRQCVKRLVCCRFCHESHLYDGSDNERTASFQQDPVDRFEGLSKHESICANKTVKCSLCQKYIMVRYIIQHSVFEHQLEGMLILIEISIIVVPDHFVYCDFCGFRQNCLFSLCLVRGIIVLEL